MTETSASPPSFNLWTEPWITLERANGPSERLGIAETLRRAHEFLAIYEPSPLVVVGIHRLLAAILQDALRPQSQIALEALVAEGAFPPGAIAAFGERYAARFDLFSLDAPFLQSADLPLTPGKGDNAKTVAYLAMELPSGTAVTHYHHGGESAQTFCSVCAARGLATIPAWATSGGAGIKPSINGVPPIYVLPGGHNLFESLAASLILPEKQPEVADRERDAAWWVRPPLVARSAELVNVGYLHSLTFPARRVRLHPTPMDTPCSRCGQESAWGVHTMIFEMGESRVKDAPPWFDPFCAYRLPDPKSAKGPTPIRPQPGKALWREFTGLFLASNEKNRRPTVLDQLAEMHVEDEFTLYPIRCVGVRTDMKAKVFEWVDADFALPGALLGDPGAALLVEEALELATDSASALTFAFRKQFAGKNKKQELHQRLRERMGDDYWAALAAPFRQFILELAAVDERAAARRRWADVVFTQGVAAFCRAAEQVGDDAESLRKAVLGENICRGMLGKKRKEYVPHE